MGWLIFTAIWALVLGGCLITFMASTKGEDSRVVAPVVAGLATIVWIVISLFSMVHTVGQRQVGIVYNFSGTVTGKVDPGVAWTAPWQHIKKENVGLQKELFDLDQSNSAVSSDQQPIYSKVALNYEVQPSEVVQLFKTVGPNWKSILLDSRVLQDYKEVTASLSAAQITTNREKLRIDTKKRLVDELQQYGVRVVDFFVTNIDYAQSYKEAINSKNVQAQKSLQALAKVDQAKAEADQVAAEASGHARATIANARADALAINLKGKALRAHPEVLQLEAIDQLNPKAQLIICANASAQCPSFIPNTVKP